MSSVGRFVHWFRNATTPDTTRRASTPEEIQRMLASSDAGSFSGAPVTESSAMAVAAVYACVRLLSDAVGMLPVSLYEKRRGGKHVEAVNDPVHKILTVAPNDWQTPYDFLRTSMVHLLLRGNVYAHKVTLGGRTVALRQLMPHLVTPQVSGNGTLTYRYRKAAGQYVTLPQSEVLHIRGVSVDGIVGMSVIEAARNAIGLAIDTEKHGALLFRNGARPSVVLKHAAQLSADAISRLKDDFDERYTGNDNAHRPLVLEEGMDISPFSMTAEDSQFVDSRKFSRSEIAMFFGVPPHAIGDVERGTSWGSGIEQQNLGFLVHTLKPYLTNLSQAFLRDLLPPDERAKYVVKFDTSELTRADFLARQSGLKIQHDSGVINADEWRKIEGLDPIESEESQRYSRVGSANTSPAESRQAPARSDQGPSGGQQSRARANLRVAA